MNAAGKKSSLVLWAIGPAFVAVGAWLALAGPHAEIPRGQVRNIPLEEIRPGAWRAPLSDASKSTVRGVTRPCSECHKLFTPSPVETRTLVQHKDVVMRHGMNVRCFNCHHAEERDKLVLHDGTLVDFDQTPRLCSQCHGTVYRDWQRGMHGKTMGSWDATSGKQIRLTCNQCHDPHSPAYKPVAPLPGPETMRMGDQKREAEREKRHTPLRQWSQPPLAEPGSKPAGHDEREIEKKPDAKDAHEKSDTPGGGHEKSEDKHDTKGGGA